MLRHLFTLALLLIAFGSAQAQTSYTWRTSLSGDWSNPQNWNPAGVPGPDDAATIPSGIVTISSPVEVARLTMSGNGSVRRDAQLTVRDQFNWSGGTLTGTAAIVLPTGSTTSLAGTAQKTLTYGPLENAGTISWTGGNLFVSNNASITNSGRLELHADTRLLAGSTIAITNTGTIVKRAGSGTTELQGSLANEGLVEVQVGTLIVPGGTSGGAFRGAAGTLLRFSVGNPVLTASSSVESAGDVELHPLNNASVAGTFTVAGRTLLTRGTTSFTGTGQTFGRRVILAGGNADLGSNPLVVEDLEMTQGNLQNQAAISVSDSLRWAFGAIRGTGDVEIPTGAVLVIQGTSSRVLEGRPLRNAGRIVWTSTTTVQLQNGGWVQNDGEIELQAGGRLVGVGVPTPRLVNEGTIRGKSGPATFTIGSSVILENQGQISLESGTLVVAGGTNTGRIQSVKDGALVVQDNPSNRPFVLEAGTVLDMTGPVELRGWGLLRVAVPLTLPPQILVNGPAAQLLLDADAVLGGEVHLAQGWVAGSGSLRILSGGTLRTTGSSQNYLQLPIQNEGTLVFQHTGTLMAEHFVLENSGVFEVQGTGRLIGSLGAYRPINNLPGGVIRRTAAGAFQFRFVKVHNRGTVEIENGDLQFFGVADPNVYRQTEGATVLKGGTLSMIRDEGGIARVPVRIEGGVVTGAGTLHAHVVNSGIVRPGAGPEETGIIAVNGLFEQTSTGVLDLELGGPAEGTDYDQLDAHQAKLSGTLNLIRIRSYVPGASDLHVPVRWSEAVREGQFTTINGLDFAPGVRLNASYASTELSVYNYGAQLSFVDARVYGPGLGRRGRKVKYTVTLRNNGTQTVLVPVVLDLDNTPNLNLDPWRPGPDPYEDLQQRLPIELPPPPPGENYPSIPRYWHDANSNRYKVPMVVALPPGSSIDIPVESDCGKNSVNIHVGQPIDPINDNAISNCLFNLMPTLLDFVPGYDCVKFGLNVFNSAAQAVTTPKRFDALATTGTIVLAAGQCAASIFPPTKVISTLINVNDAIYRSINLKNSADACLGPFFTDPTGGRRASSPTDCGRATDPNDKVGPEGVTAGRYVTGEDTLLYAVFFENKPGATLPAQQVVVTDTLDVQQYDLSTFSFGTVSFGGTHLEAPAGSQAFTAQGFVADSSLIGRVQAGIDLQTGVITWTFDTLDPATGQPTENPLAGFLPPNVNPPDGEGVVTYTVLARPNLADGTVLGSAARIVFDTEDPIDTPVWTNRIDRTAPESRVTTLGVPTPDGHFTVKWAGTDQGSGIAAYSIFVSVDGGAFTAWRENTTVTEAVFEGQFGRQYAFYSIARDFLGHVEAAPETPDAVTKELPACPDGLKITGFDADQGASDTQEYVQITNQTTEAASLAGCVLVFFDGANSASYFAMDLAGAVAGGAAFTVGNPGVEGALLTFPANTLQDGPDAIALYRGAASAFPNGTKVHRTGLLSSIVYLSDGNIYGASKLAVATTSEEDLMRLLELSGGEAAPEIPAHYTLQANYPNPFNPSTTIRYGLPEAAEVELVVYDVLGREVRRLVQGRMEAGWQEVSWDGRDASGQAVGSGIYLYRLEAGSFRETRRMLLLK